MPSSTTKLTPKISGSIFGMEKNVPLSDLQKNVCDLIVGANCPIQANSKTTWKLTLPIPESLPTMKADLKGKMNEFN